MYSDHYHLKHLQLRMSPVQFLPGATSVDSSGAKRQSSFSYKHGRLFIFSLLFQSYKKTRRKFKSTSAKETNRLVQRGKRWFKKKRIGVKLAICLGSYCYQQKRKQLISCELKLFTSHRKLKLWLLKKKQNKTPSDSDSPHSEKHIQWERLGKDNDRESRVSGMLR